MRPFPLTPSQVDCLRVVCELMDATGACPTQREIADELDVTHHRTVGQMLDRIAERGWIRRLPGRHRALQILHRPPPVEPVSFEAVSPASPAPAVLAAAEAGFRALARHSGGDAA